MKNYIVYGVVVAIGVGALVRYVDMKEVRAARSVVESARAEIADAKTHCFLHWHSEVLRLAPKVPE